MKAHWMALGIGVVVGAVVAMVMKGGKGGNTLGITGSENRPFQARISQS